MHFQTLLDSEASRFSNEKEELSILITQSEEQRKHLEDEQLALRNQINDLKDQNLGYEARVEQLTDELNRLMQQAEDERQRIVLEHTCWFSPFIGWRHITVLLLPIGYSSGDLMKLK